jgi:hypothetical protein
VIAPQVAELIAADRIAERQRHATAARLAALARCCRPSAWATAAGGFARGLTRLRGVVRGHRHVAAPCCA